MPPDKPARGNRRSSRPAPRRGGAGVSNLLLGVALGLIAAFAALWLYHRFEHPAAHSPAAETADQPISPTSPRPPAAASHSASQPPAAKPETPPFGISEDVFESGARLYSARCAACHGTPRRSAAAAHPTALQLWQANRAGGGTGVSHQTPAQIYHSIAEGQPAAGMPAYRGVLTSTQIWQLSLLLQSAGQDLPDPVLRLLDAPKP